MYNKRNITVLLSLFAILPVSAQLDGDGFYRVQNTNTERYVSIIDDESYTILATTDPDLSALVTRKGFDNIVGDPSTVFYIEYMGTRSSDNNKYYDMEGQGTGIYAISKHYLYIKSFTSDDGTYYRAWAEEYGNAFYVSDEKGDYDPGYIGTNNGYKNWYIWPVTSDNDDCYFGIVPTVEANGKYYATIYCGFPMEAASDGVKFYYVEGTWGDECYYNELTTVPAKTPVIVECSSEDPSDNRVDMLTGSYSSISDNILGGVMFNADIMHHDDNYTAYDENSMRVLGVLSDGSIGFIKADEDDSNIDEDGHLLANSAYLDISSSSNATDEIKMLLVTAGINEVSVDDETTPSDIYTLSGTKVRSNSTSTEGLNPGIYIINKKKVIVK